MNYKGFNLYFFQLMFASGIFWMRLFGWGFHIKDITRRPLIYSERNGCYKILKFRRWRLRLLYPEMMKKDEHRKVLKFRTPEEITPAEWKSYSYPQKWNFVQIWKSQEIDWQTRLGKYNQANTPTK